MTTLLKVTKMPWFGLLKKGKIEKNFNPHHNSFTKLNQRKKTDMLF